MTTNEQNHTPENDATKEQEPEVAFYPDGSAMVRVEGLELHFADATTRPRVRDLDLAAWLGFKTPRMIRKLIKRMAGEGKLRGIDWRSAVERQSTGNGASREYTVTEAWLNREQALLVATQSDTPRAWALTETMVRIFEAVLSRRAEAPPFAEAVAAGVAQVLAQWPDMVRLQSALVAKVADLEASVASGVIGPVVADAEITQPLRRIALLLADPKTGSTRGPRRSAENRLRNLLGYTVKGSQWAMLPRTLLAVAQRQLALWLDEAIFTRASRSAANQQGFAFVRGVA